MKGHLWRHHWFYSRTGTKEVSWLQKISLSLLVWYSTDISNELNSIFVLSNAPFGPFSDALRESSFLREREAFFHSAGGHCHFLIARSFFSHWSFWNRCGFRLTKAWMFVRRCTELQLTEQFYTSWCITVPAPIRVCCRKTKRIIFMHPNLTFYEILTFLRSCGRGLRSMGFTGIDGPSTGELWRCMFSENENERVSMLYSAVWKGDGLA